MPAPPHSGGGGGHSDAEVLLQAANWLKWIRDDALDERPALPVNIDEINAVIEVLERLAYQFDR